MASKIKVKTILELQSKNLSRNQIADLRGMSRNSVSQVIKIANELGIKYSDVADKDPETVYKLFFPDRHSTESIYGQPDYDYIHGELKRVGVTLKLLWQEYQTKCAAESTISMGYTRFCKGYADHTEANMITSHLVHKPGHSVEVDWSGSTMQYVNPTTGEIIKVYLFAGTLPYSQYSYVEPSMDMKQTTWLRCHVHMFEYFNGVPLRITCDNLKTGVIKHPKEGDIILNEEYDALAQHYMTTVMPARVRRPRDKPSIESTVGDIATAVIAKLRNRKFISFEELRQDVWLALEEYNAADFQKREGSRIKVFQEEEQRYLHRLPDIPYETAEWVYSRSIGLNSHVVYAKNYYSCPFQYFGKKVDLRITDTQLAIYCNDQRIQTHPKFPAYVTNKYSTYEEDMPEKLKYTEWDDVRIKQWATKIGPSTRQVVDLIFSMVKIKEQGYNSSLSVLRLTKSYSEARLETACELALTKVRVPRYHHLKAILSANQDVLYSNGKQSAQAPEVPPKGYVRGAEYYRGRNK